MRKLLFSTSSQVMKTVLLRGLASHNSDRKLLVGIFDLLRDNLKFSPTITVEQFFSTGFASHKLTMITKLAEYVAQTDRSTIYSPTKTKFVARSPIIDNINTRIRSNTYGGQEGALGWGDDVADSGTVYSAGGTGRKSKLTGSKGRGVSGVDEDILTVLLDDNRSKGGSSATKSATSTKGMAGGKSNREVIDDLTRKLNQDLFPLTSAPSTPFATPSHHPPQAPDSSQVIVMGRSQSPANKRGGAVAKGAEKAGSKESHQQMQVVANNPASPPPPPPSFTPEQWEQIEKLVAQRVEKAVAEVNERHEYIMSRLVSAVDGEFSLLQKRVQELEDFIQSHTREDVPNGGDH
eukprot:gene34920-42289_t